MNDALEPNDASAPWERLASNLRVERALLSALDLLEGIPVVVFKGGLLTRRIYGDLRLRSSADNDLLVRRVDAHRALERFASRGFVPLEGLDAHRALDRTGQVALWMHGDFDLPSVDLHVEAFSRNFFSVDEATIWSRLETVELHGRSVQTFDGSLTMAHLVAHFFQSLLERRQLADIAAAWRHFGENLARDADSSPAFWATIDQTVGRAALEYALGLALAGSAVPFEARSARARRALEFWGRVWLDENPATSLRGLVAVLVADPRHLFRSLYRGFCPELDELHSLYGSGHPVRLLLTHWRHRLRF